jgi:hypothetical protein
MFLSIISYVLKDGNEFWRQLAVSICDFICLDVMTEQLSNNDRGTQCCGTLLCVLACSRIGVKSCYFHRSCSHLLNMCEVSYSPSNGGRVPWINYPSYLSGMTS